MDDQNVITLSTDINALDSEMRKWLNLTYKQRKNSDVICIQRYGCTNVELFNKEKAALETFNTYTENVQESGFVQYADDAIDLHLQSIYDKIESSSIIQSNNENITIIDDFVEGTDTEYGIADLYEKYNKYLYTAQNYKGYSNDYSMQIWGRAVPAMFTYMRGKIESKESSNRMEKPIEDLEMQQYKNEIDKVSESLDVIRYAYYMIDCYGKHDSLYESAVLESFADRAEFKNKANYNADIPAIVPYLTPDEYVTLNDMDPMVTPFDYIFIHDGEKYHKIIHDLQMQLDTDKKEIAETELLKLGWNPWVKITGESLKFAREKQINWLNLNEGFSLIDLSRYSTDIKDTYDDEGNMNKAIYMVILSNNDKTGISDIKYIGISISDTLANIHTVYSLNGNNAITINSLKYNSDLKLTVIAEFADEEICRILNDKLTTGEYKIEPLLKNGACSISVLCAQFSNIIWNIVSESDEACYNLKKDYRAYILFDGEIKEYDLDRIAGLSYILVNKPKIDNASNFDIDAVDKTKLESVYLKSTDMKTDKILKEAAKQIDIKPVIVESKMPFGFKDNGSFYIDLPKSIRRQYTEIHRILGSYNENNIDGIKHEIAALFYLNSIIEKRLKKTKKDTDNYKALIDLRAMILNDFSVYMKVVLAVDPKFDFSQYLKTTEFSDASFSIDKDTMAYSWKTLKDLKKMIKGDKK